MSEPFGNAARRLAGAAGVAFGWTPEIFWAATPDELASLFAAIAPAAETPPAAPDIAKLKERFPDG